MSLFRKNKEDLASTLPALLQSKENVFYKVINYLSEKYAEPYHLSDDGKTLQFHDEQLFTVIKEDNRQRLTIFTDYLFRPSASQEKDALLVVNQLNNEYVLKAMLQDGCIKLDFSFFVEPSTDIPRLMPELVKSAHSMYDRLLTLLREHGLIAEQKMENQEDGTTDDTESGTESDNTDENDPFVTELPEDKKGGSLEQSMNALKQLGCKPYYNTKTENISVRYQGLWFTSFLNNESAILTTIVYDVMVFPSYDIDRISALRTKINDNHWRQTATVLYNINNDEKTVHVSLKHHTVLPLDKDQTASLFQYHYNELIDGYHKLHVAMQEGEK